MRGGVLVLSIPSGRLDVKFCRFRFVWGLGGVFRPKCR
jgi:hypothetical protein